MTGTLPAHFEREGVSTPFAKNHRLRNAVHRYAAVSRKGLEERLFTLAFTGLVYPQIWEDPVVDLEALDLKAGEHLVAIASGGCNVLQLSRPPPTCASRPSTSIRRTSRSTSSSSPRSTHLPDYETFRALLRATPTRSRTSRPMSDYLRAASRRRDAQLLGSARPPRPPPHRLLRLATSTATACSAASSAPGTCWRARMAAIRAAARRPRTAREQRRIFDEELAPLFEQAPHPLAARQAVVAVRPRHPAVAVRRR